MESQRKKKTIRDIRYLVKKFEHIYNWRHKQKRERIKQNKLLNDNGSDFFH